MIVCVSALLCFPIQGLKIKHALESSLFCTLRSHRRRINTRASLTSRRSELFQPIDYCYQNVGNYSWTHSMATTVDGSRRLKSETYHQTRGDRLSNLPLDVIQMILECMPVEDAVRTSALSRNWRYNWRTISKLVFDESFFAYLESKNSDASVITNILHLHHNPRISCFHLYVQHILSSELVGDWLLLLSRKGVKKLSLVYERYNCTPRKCLPIQVYSFVELTHLYIEGFGFDIPSNFRCFPNLFSIELHWVDFDDKSFGDFITSCPFLESMMLCLGFPAHHLNIRSRSLKHLTLEFVFTSICIEASALKTLSLNAVVTPGGSSLVHTLCNVPSIEKLSLGTIALAGTCPMMLPTPLYLLKNITFYLIDLDETEVIQSVICILRSSPALEELQFLSNPKLMGNAVERVPSSLGEDTTLGSLKVVKFVNLGGSGPELEMIRFILASSPSLEKIFVKIHRYVNSKLCKQISAELMRFDPVSRKAEVTYSGHLQWFKAPPSPNTS